METHRESLVIAKGVARDTLYMTSAEICKGELNMAYDEISAGLWHKRMGHISEKCLQISKYSLKYFAKYMTVKACDYNLLCKQHRVSFRYRLKENLIYLI